MSFLATSDTLRRKGTNIILKTLILVSFLVARIRSLRRIRRAGL